MTIKPLRLLHETLVQSAERFPVKTALVVEGNSFTYSQLCDTSARIAFLLLERGLKRGDRVAIYMDNTFMAAASIYGALMAGGCFLVINPQTKSDKLEYILNDSGAKILITDAHLSFAFEPILKSLKDLAGLFYSGEWVSPVPDHSALLFPVNALSEVLPKAMALAHSLTIIPLDLSALIYTSGSTGNPKGVMQTHQSMLFAAQSIAQYLRLNSDHRVLNVLPLAFDYGLYQLLMSILMGATLVLERSFAFPAQIFNRMNEQKVSVFPGVPTIYSTIISMHRRKPLCFPLVDRITNTAAALPADYNAELRQIFSNALIYRMYGLTECKRVCYLEPEKADLKPESVGRAIPGTEVFLLSPEGKPVGPGSPGVLHVRGPHVMLGYWKLPEQSRKMLKEGHYPGERILCTHDWFTMDEDGDLYFKGRSDDIIKSRGEKVSPVEVENVLLGLKGVREAAVIGVADELLGQAVKAFVVVDDQAITDRHILKHCTLRLENFMVPKYIEIVADLLKTESGKITKKDLK